MATKKKAAASRTSQPRQDASTFVHEFAARQRQLLEAIVERAQKGDVSIDNSERSERYLASIISEWCETKDPSLDLHLEMLGAVFYEALLDRMWEINPQSIEQPAHTDARGYSVNEVLIEVLRTAQMFLGRK